MITHGNDEPFNDPSITPLHIRLSISMTKGSCSLGGCWGVKLWALHSHQSKPSPQSLPLAGLATNSCLRHNSQFMRIADSLPNKYYNTETCYIPTADPDLTVDVVVSSTEIWLRREIFGES